MVVADDPKVQPQASPPMTSGRELVESFTYMHHLRRDPRVTPQMAPFVQAKYDQLHTAMLSLAHTPSAPAEVRENARSLVYAATADDDAYQFMPSLLGYGKDIDEKRRPVREAEIKRRGLEATIAERAKAIAEASKQQPAGDVFLTPITPEQARNKAVDDYFREIIGPDIDDAVSNDYALTRPSGSFLGFGKVTPSFGKPKVNEKLSSFPIGNNLEEGFEAFQILNQQNPVQKDAKGSFIMVRDARTGEPKRYDIPSNLASLGSETARSWTEALRGRDPYSMQVARVALGTGVAGRLMLEGSNAAAGTMVGQAMHAINLDYQRGVDFDVDSMIGTVPFIPKITGEKAVDRQLLRDPIAMRMLLELDENGSFWGTLLGGVAGVADFMATQHAIGKGLGLAGAASRAAGLTLARVPFGPVKMTATMRRWGADFAKRSSVATWARGAMVRGGPNSGLHFGTARNIVQEAAYGGVAGLLDPRSSFWSGVAGGIHEGIVEGALSPVAANIWRAGGKVAAATRLTAVGERVAAALPLIRRMDLRYLDAPTRDRILRLDATRAGLVPDDVLRSARGSLPSSSPELRRVLAKRYQNAEVQQEIATALDIMLVGAGSYAHFAAMAKLDGADPDSPGYWAAFQEALLSTDAIASGLGMVAGGLGASGVRRVLGSEPMIVRESGVGDVQSITRDEALTEAAHVLWEDLANPNANADRLRFLSAAGQLVAEEMRVDPTAGTRERSGPLWRATSPSKADGYDADLKAFMEDTGAVSPFAIRWDQFEAWRQKNGKGKVGQPVQLGGGQLVEYLNQARGVDRSQPGFIFSAGEALAQLYATPKRSVGSVKQAVKQAKSVDLVGIARDLFRLPQMFTELLPGEAGATRRHVMRTARLVQRELERRMKNPPQGPPTPPPGSTQPPGVPPSAPQTPPAGGNVPPSAPQPSAPLPPPVTTAPSQGNYLRLKGAAGPVWVNVTELAAVAQRYPDTIRAENLARVYGLSTVDAATLGLAASNAVLGLDKDARKGPVVRGTPESLRGKLVDLEEQNVEPSAYPPEAAAGERRAMERLSVPGALSQADLEAEAETEAQATLGARGKGPPPEPAELLADAAPLKAALEQGNGNAAVEAEALIERLRAAEASIAEELELALNPPAPESSPSGASNEGAKQEPAPAPDAAAVIELEGMLQQVQASVVGLQEAVDGLPLAHEAQGEGADIARALEVAHQNEELARQEITLDEQLHPELSALGLSLEEARAQAVAGTLDAPPWFTRLLTGEDRVQTPEDAARTLRAVAEPWRSSPTWMLDPEGELARVTQKYVGRAESVNRSSAEAAVQRSIADAAARPLPGQASAFLDADLRADLEAASLEAAADGDQGLAAALGRQAELAGAIPDAEVEQAVEQLQDPERVSPRYQGDLFDPANDAERAAFEAGGQLFGAVSSLGGWRQSMVTYITAGDTPAGLRKRAALVDGAVYSSGGGSAALELIDAAFNLEAGSAARRYQELATLGLERNREIIQGALARVTDRAGVKIELDRMRPEMQAALGLLSLGAPLSTTASGENKIDTPAMSATLGRLLVDGDPSPAEVLERSRKVALEGWTDGFGHRSGGFVSPADGERAVDQAAAWVALTARRMLAVARKRKTKIKQEGVNARIANALKKKLGIGAGPSDKLGGLTPVQVGNLVVEEITGTTPSIIGRKVMASDALAEQAVQAGRQRFDDIAREAAALGGRFSRAMAAGDTAEAGAALRAMVAITQSSTALAEDAYVALSDIRGEDGLPLLDPSLDDVQDSPELRFWLRVLASPGSSHNTRLRGLAAKSGIGEVEIDALGRKAAEIIANHDTLLRFMFNMRSGQARPRSIAATTTDVEVAAEDGGESLEVVENRAGHSFYESFREVLRRHADGQLVATDQEAEDFNHWSDSWGIPLVRKLGDRWVLNEAGIARANDLVQDELVRLSKMSETELESPVFFYDLGFLVAGIPRWINDTLGRYYPKEPLHKGYELAVKTLDSMGLGFVGNMMRGPTEFVGRRTLAVGKGRVERAQDVKGAKVTASSKLQAEEFVIETAHVIGDYWAGLPQHLRKAAGFLVDSGAWLEVKSAKHLATVLNEPFTPRIQRLYGALLDYNWRILEIGRRGVMHGFISREQWQHFTQGALDPRKPVPKDTPARTRYLMAALAPKPGGSPHNQSVNPNNRAQRDGIYALIGREMARDQGAVLDSSRRIYDPMVGLSQSVAQESNQIALYRWLQKAANRFGVKWADVDTTIPPHERRAFMVAAVPLQYESNRDPVSGRRVLPVQRAVADWVRTMRASEELYRQTNGAEGTRPNPRRTAMLDNLVPLDGTPGVAITRHNIADLKFMLEQYATDGDYGNALLRIMDGWAARWRRTRTTSRVSHIFMSQMSATFANLALGGVTFGEFTQGVLLNRGPYADAGEAQSLMAEHMANPTKGIDQHPLVQEYRWFMEQIGDTTMVSNLVDSHALFDQRSKLARLAGIPVDAVGESGKVANAMARITAAELGTADGVERAIARALAKNPSESEAMVRGSGLHTAHYHAAEMFHKFAAYLSLSRRNTARAATDEGRIELAREAANASGNYAEFSPVYREFTTRIRNSPIDVAYREGFERIRNYTDPAARMLMSVPFLGFVTVMAPAAAGAMLRNFGAGGIKMAAAAAFAAGSLMAVFKMLGGQDQEERTEELTEAATGTRLRRGGDWTREASDLWRSRHGALVPRTIGPIDMTGELSRSLKDAAHLYLGQAGRGTLMMQAAPDWYGRGALVSTTHYLSATPFEFMLRMAQDVGLGKFAADVKRGDAFEAGADMMKAMALSDALQGWTTQHSLGVLWATKGLIFPATDEDRVRSLEFMRDQVAADLNPMTAVFSSTAQKFFQATALRGTPMREFVMGIRRPEAADLSAAQRLAGAGLASLMPVQEVPARRELVARLRSKPERIFAAIVGDKYRGANDLSGFTEDHKAARKMQEVTKRAFEGVVRGAYERTRRLGAMATPLSVTLGDELRFLGEGVQEIHANGTTTLGLKPGYTPDGELARFVARQQGLDREYAIAWLKEYVNGLGDRLPMATTQLHRALELNSIDGSVAMRIWDAIVSPSPSRVLHIIAEDMQDPRNHFPLQMVWDGVRADLGREFEAGGYASKADKKLYAELESQFQAMDFNDVDPVVGSRAADVLPRLLLNR